MSQDEIIALFGSVAVAAWFWYRWYLPAITLPRFTARYRGLVVITPAFCGLLLLLILRTLASHDVRDEPVYLFMYMAMGAAWVGLVTYVAGLLDVHVRDDVLERGNPAAAAQSVGLLVGATLAFAGANIGDGPSWLVVVFCAGMATLTLLLLWTILALSADLAERISIERDAGTGIRHAAWLAAVGLIVGRAAAGDWTSAEAAFVDFLRYGWPTLVLLLMAITVERLAQRSSAALTGAACFVYLTLAAGWVVFLGVPE